MKSKKTKRLKKKKIERTEIQNMDIFPLGRQSFWMFYELEENVFTKTEEIYPKKSSKKTLNKKK